jgi:tetratricopeptide (TPR) repeat protein
MKQILLLAILTGCIHILHAQDFTKVKTSVIVPGQLETAKTSIDKLMQDPKAQAKAEGWMWDMVVYAGLYADDKLRAKYPRPELVADSAFERYHALDPTYKLVVDNSQQTFAGQMYSESFNFGVSTYNQKKYDSSFYFFKLAVKYSDVIFKNKWSKDTTLSMDTLSILYAGVTADKIGNRDEAAKYYGRIASNKIAKIASNDMIDIYKWLADYYEQKKDKASAFAYLTLGQQVFPADQYWPVTELDYWRKDGNKDSLFATYDQVCKQYPTNYLFFYNYGLEVYQYASDTTSGHRPANADELVAKARQNLNKALELKPDYPQAAMVLGQISYNEGVDLQMQAKAVKGATPDMVKKRTDLRAASTKKFDEAIPYFQKVDEDLGGKGKLKMEEKQTLKDSYDVLITIYEQKNVKDKIDSYTAKYNDVDKVH